MNYAESPTPPQRRAAEIAQYKQLVELQQQIVAIARRKEDVERDCLALRKQVARATKRRRLWSLGAVLRRLFQRLTRATHKDLGPAWPLQQPPADPTTA